MSIELTRAKVNSNLITFWVKGTQIQGSYYHKSRVLNLWEGTIGICKKPLEKAPTIKGLIKEVEKEIENR
jgi:hypothetical protein